MLPMSDDSHDLPTPRSTLRANYRVLVWCKACKHQAEAKNFVAEGQGDTPLIKLHYRCGNCAGGSRFTDWVVTNGYMPQPWHVETAPPERKE
jgi:hypothetical protein